MANAYITATVQGVTSTAYHMWMGSVTGTPTSVDKTSDNTYTIVLSYDGESGTSMDSLILTDGNIESCSYLSGGWKMEKWSDDEYCATHYNSCSIEVKLSSNATWLSLRPGTPLLSSGWPDTTYCNGVDFGANFIRWNIKNSPQLTIPGTPTVSYANNIFSLQWSASSGSNGSGNVTYRVVYGDSTNGATAYSTSWSTNTSASIARWINPTWNNITYSFYVQAKYSDITKSSGTSTHTLTAPSVAWSNTSINVAQVNNQIAVSWSAASINNNYSSESIVYSVACTTKAQAWGGPSYSADTSNTSITFTPPAYDEELFIQITAWANNVSGGQYSEAKYFTAYSAIVSAPGKPNVTLNDSTFTVSWTPATGQYGAAGSIVQYSVSYADSVSWSTKQTSKTSSTSIAIPKWVSATSSDVDCMFNVNAYYDQASSYSTTTTYTLKAPTLSDPGKPKVMQSGGSYVISWAPAIGSYGSGDVTYVIYIGDSYEFNVGKGTINDGVVTYTCTIPSECYGKSVTIAVQALYGNLDAWNWSDGFIAELLTAYTIRCYIDGRWQDCIIRYYDGENWIDSIATYFDGAQWIECSF